jgi:16S rRNA processing protein RimM
MRSDDLVIMGYVSGAFGVRGWVKIHADTEYADSLFDYPVWWLGKGDSFKAYTFEEGAVHTKALAAKLAGVEGRDQAQALRGCEIAVPRAQLPKTEEGEYYWSDLIGLEVVNQEGITLGKVKNLLETGANDVLVLADEGKERLLPFVNQVVLAVDLAAGRISVDWGEDF